MDWMYRDSSQVVDPEEYLLGRKVDKQFEKSALPPDKDQEPLPTSIFSGPAANSQVDIARKLQEDPLYLIKKKEIESREQLLKNPRKLKQLQEMLARQQAAAEKLRKKQMKKSKKLKKSKDLDTLIAKKCKQLLGGLDLKKLDALENDTSSDSSSCSSDSNSHGSKKKKKSKDLDKLLALKYKKLLGKVDQKVLNELSSSSESERGDTKNQKTKKVSSSSSGSESSSDNEKKKQVSAADRRRLKRNGLKTNEKRRTRDSSSDSGGANWEQKKKMHSESKVLDKRKYTYRENQIKGSRDEDNRNSKHGKVFDERKTRHDKYQYNHYEQNRTDSEDVKYKRNNEKHNYKKDTKTKVEDESGQKYSRKRRDSSSSSSESRGKKKKPSETRGKSRQLTKHTTSSNSDSDSSINKKKSQEKKQYGLVLPANYVPKKKTDIDTRKPEPEKTTDVKPYRKEDRQKLTEEEKERRLKEMMTNAKWRDDLRETNIKNYQKKIEAEKDNHEYNEDFMRNQMSYAMSQGTVESRVKAKINTIQRNKGSMSENFARRN